MSGFDLESTIKKSKKKAEKAAVSKIDDAAPKSTKTGKNASPAAIVRDSAASGLGNLSSGLGVIASDMYKQLTKSNSAISPSAGTCGGERRRNKSEFVEHASRGFKDYDGTSKVFCSAASAVKLNIGAAKQAEGEGGVAENVLNDYLNVQYNIVFSMIPEGKTISIQEAIPLDNDQKQRDLVSELKAGQAVILASTGGAFNNDTAVIDINARNEREGRRNNIYNGIAPPGTPGAPIPPGVTGSAGDITAQLNALRQADYEPTYEAVDVSDRNYYSIQELVIENFNAPTNKNPGISSMISGKMVLAEPGGFRFNDDIKSLGAKLGYEKINIGRILYRLDISFSGYDPTTGRWEPVIDMDTRKGKRIPFLTYYVTITKLEAKVTNTGTVYEINIAPSAASILRAEDFVTDAGTVFAGESNTFGGFLDNFEKNLTKRRSEETTQGVTRPSGLTREFEIIAPEALRAATFYADAWALEKSYLKESASGSLISGGKDIDILTILTAALGDLPYVHELFIARTSEYDNSQFVRPRTHFTTRFNVVYGVPNDEVGDYSNMKIQIIIEPFVSFKKGSYSAKSVGEYTAVEAQIRRVKQMQSLGAIVRKYDYYNASSNTEVLDFGINLQAFFTESLDSSQDFPGTKGVGVASSSAQQVENLQKSGAQVFAEAVQTQIGSTLTGVTTNDARFETRLGDGSVAAKTAANNNLTPYGVLGGGKSIAPDQYSYGGITSEGAILAARKNTYMREMKDWLANDQQQIDNLHVRGDPLWLLSPYASNDMNRVEQLSPMIRPQTDSVIFINIKAPHQRDYANPDYYDGSQRKPNPNVMGGFYGVSRVTSTFSGGSFTQIINGYKLNHLNYVEESITFEDIIGSTLSDKTASDGISPGTSQIAPNALQAPPKQVGDAAPGAGSLNNVTGDVIVITNGLTIRGNGDQ